MPCYLIRHLTRQLQVAVYVNEVRIAFANKGNPSGSYQLSAGCASCGRQIRYEGLRATGIVRVVKEDHLRKISVLITIVHAKVAYRPLWRTCSSADTTIFIAASRQ